MSDLESQLIQTQAECYRHIKTIESLNMAFTQLAQSAGVSSFPELQDFIAKAKTPVESEVE